MYNIEVDRERALLTVKLSGMMTVEEVADYIDELKRLVATNRLRGYSLLLDVSECPIQHQEVVHALAQHMATMPKARAIAIVTGSSLARMQVRRLFKQPYSRIVSTLAEGHAWINASAGPTPERSIA